MKNTDALPKIANAEDSEKGVIKKKVTTRQLEIWECAQLSSNFVPSSKPSDLFRKLEERRKERHENRMKQLAKDLNEINLKTENNIKMSSMEVKAHIKNFNDQLKEILVKIDKPEVASYCTSVFLDFQNKANDFKTQQQKLVNELYDDLIKFENNRAKENEQVLHVACEELRKIGYFLPYELQSFVEHKVMEMNQLLLNNRRCYCDLKLTLTLVNEETFKSFIDKVFCIREKWVHHKVQEAVFNMQSDTEKKIARLASEDYYRLEVKGLELIVELSPDNLHSICKTEEWSKNVTKVLEMIEIHGSNIIELYRKTLDAVYRSFDNKVEEIKKQLNSVEKLTIEERVIKPILFEVKSEQWKEIENLEMFWQENLDDIKLTLQEVTEFLMDAGKLWDRHTERLCESKKLILRALEKAEENNQAVFQDLEIKLNIALDSLRQEHVKNKLDKAHEAVVAILNLIKAKYESSYLGDVAIVEDFYKMMALEADVLSAELKEFIYVSHMLTNIRTGPNWCDQYRGLPERKLVCKEIQICAHKIKAVKSWKSGVWIAMENLALRTRESLQPRAESWVQKRIDGLAEKMSIQMELLEKRFKRIKTEFYEKRLEEIDFHQNVYDQHREGIKAVYQKIKEDLANLIEREGKKLSEIEKNFWGIEESVKLESSPGIVLSNKILIQRKQDETQNDLKIIFEKFRVDCEIKMTDLKQSNVDFMKDIKLFHENGNYSAEECKMFVTLLEAIDKEINTELKNIVKDVTKEEGELVKKCSLAFTPIINLLNLIYEETLFIHDIRERLKDVAEDIRQLAGRLKSDFKVLNDQVNCFFKCFDNDEFLKKNHQRMWSVLIDSVYKNVSNLFYPVKLPVTPVESVEAEGEHSSLEGEAGMMTPCFGLAMFSTKVTISATPTFRSLQIEENLTCKDFKPLLFGGEDPPENDGTFMAIISNRLWVEMDTLQKAACTFYKKVKGRKLIKEDMIPVNYESFVEEILTKFQLYNVQCEQLWLRLILDFLPILGQIKWTIYQFLERVIKKYQETMMTTLKTYHDDFVSCLESQSSKTHELFDMLDNKLMPLHGYPQNKSLLDELEEEVVERTAGLGIEWDAIIKKFKNRLKYFRCYHLKNRIEVDKIQILFNKMKEKIFVEYLGSSLLNTIVEWTTRGGFLTFRSLKVNLMGDGEENSVTSGDVPDNYKLYLNSVDGKLHSVQTYLKYLKELVEVERSKASDTISCPGNYVGNAGESYTKGIRPKLNVLLELPDFEVWIVKILEKVERELKMMKTFAESKENVHEEALFKWLNVWKFNVKKVRKLYSVCYEESPKSPEKVTTILGKS